MADTVSLIPNPRILIAITHNPMKPVDALCELIDNAIDSFFEAERSGKPITNPTIEITLPRPVDVESGIGGVIVRDNGYGLTAEQARSAVTAGFSSHDPFTNLGLFGLGFNIATGKLGRKTVFETSTATQPNATAITIDFDRMIQANTFEAPRESKPKPSAHHSGTTVRITDWWQAGSQNAGFVSKLAKLSVSAICRQLEQSMRLFHRLFDAMGGRGNMGAQLFQLMQQAGLPRPDCRVESCVTGGADSRFYEWIAESVRSILPRLESLGLATAAEIDIDTLAARMRDEAVRSNSCVASPPMVGAFARKKASC